MVLATGTSEGTLWELTEVVRLLPPERLLVMVFTNAADYDLFRSAAEAHFTARAAEFDGREAARLAGFRWPDYPALKNPDTHISVVGTQGFIVFGPDWEPGFVRLDPTAVRALSDFGRLRKVMRQQVTPALRRVKHGLSPAPGSPLHRALPSTGCSEQRRDRPTHPTAERVARHRRHDQRSGVTSRLHRTQYGTARARRLYRPRSDGPSWSAHRGSGRALRLTHRLRQERAQTYVHAQVN